MSIIYARISSPNQAEFNGQHFSIENQINICKDYCKKNKINIIDIKSEVVSGRDINKQKILLSLLNYSNINIICYNISRFSRNTKHALEFVDKCKDRNIIIHFVEENIKLTHFSDMHRLRLGLSQSELESNQTSHRISSNNLLLKSKGWKFGRPSFGLESCKKRGIRIFKTNKTEKAIMEFILHARNGVSCNKLNKYLNKIIPDNKIPIEYYDDDEITKIEHFSKSNTLNFNEIADLLNDYNIMNRNKQWNSVTIRRIYKNLTSVDKINIKSLNL